MYFLFGKEIHRSMLVVLSWVVTCVYCCVAVAFWSEFLVEESDICSPQKDCFLHSKAENRFTRIENCTDLYDNITYDGYDSMYDIQCFRFSFGFADALRNAVGVLVLATVLMNMQAVHGVDCNLLSG